jgi:hypothetical protein
VYLGRVVSSGALCALKFLNTDHRRQVEREVVSLTALRSAGSHPNVVAMLDYSVSVQLPSRHVEGAFKERCLIVLELADGESLFDFVVHTGSFSEDFARWIFRQLLSGEDHAGFRLWVAFLFLFAMCACVCGQTDRQAGRHTVLTFPHSLTPTLPHSHTPTLALAHPHSHTHTSCIPTCRHTEKRAGRHLSWSSFHDACLLYRRYVLSCGRCLSPGLEAGKRSAGPNPSVQAGRLWVCHPSSASGTAANDVGDRDVHGSGCVPARSSVVCLRRRLTWA